MTLRRARSTIVALAAAMTALAAAAAPVQAEFGIVPGSFTAGSFQGDGVGVHAIFGEGATVDNRAGGHPFLSATSFSLTTFSPPRGGTAPAGAIRDAVIELPPGFVGNPNAVHKCSVAVLNQEGHCPNDTVVGVANVRAQQGPINGGESTGPIPDNRTFFYLPVYNMVPSYGEPALFAFYIPNPSLPVLIHPSLDSRRNYALNATVSKISDLVATSASSVALWGLPSEASHDPWRGTAGGALAGSYQAPGCLVNAVFGITDPGPESKTNAKPPKLCPSEAQPPRPFLSNPASCDGRPVLTTIHIDSWQQHGRLDSEGEPDFSDPNWKSAVAESPPVEGCGALKFGGPEAPVSLAFQPRTHAADAPSAYDVKLNLPYSEEPGGRANPTLRDTTVTLPEGVVVNPSSANGLGACTSAQIGLATPVGSTPIRFDGQPQRCPDSSKIGTVEVDTPLLEHTLDGAVYLAKQFDNPFHSLLAIYIVIEDPETGTIVKLAGHVEADKSTGRLTTTFTENPQLPFTELDLHFFGGSDASLVNPLTCGTKTTTSVLTPSSAPQTPPVTYQDSFQVGAGCVGSEGEAPNAPSFEAGTTFTNAGLYSPFVLKLSREDGSQRLTGIDLSLPPGLTGKLAGVPYCSEAQIAQARLRDKPGDGALELASPSCPAASQVGTVNVGAGAGSEPYYVQGKAYLAGPYKGAPLSMVIVTPAVAGPFDLGVVVVRTALYVDPETARITAKSDPLPTILEGIPLDVRSIAVQLDHPGGFTLNPTSCEAMSISGQAISAAGNVAQLSNRFQVGGCAGLAFKPHLKLQLKGATKRAGHPALKAVVTYPKHGTYANVARAQVGLPHSEFLDQSNLDKVCKQAELRAGACPQRSIYGRARAWTPLLDRPLEGPVYLGVGFGYKLPALVAELNGQVRILLKGKVDTTKHEGIRNTFEAVPDAPVSRFVLEMKGGKKYGLLSNSENICRKTQRASALFSGQNGTRLHLRPQIHNSCKHRKRRKARKAHARRARAARSALPLKAASVFLPG